MNKNIYYIIYPISAVVFFYLVYSIEKNQSERREIKKVDEIYLYVEDAYNERGSYVLNRKYFISSSLKIIEENAIKVKDKAIWRPKGYKHIPRSSDISAPFLIKKKGNNDTIVIEKNNKIIHLVLGEHIG